MRVGLEVHAHLAHEKMILENAEDLYRSGCDFDHHVRNLGEKCLAMFSILNKVLGIFSMLQIHV